MMTTPMTAGKPLAAPRQHRDPPRRRGLIVRFLRGLLGGLIGLMLLLGAGGAVGGWIAWQHFSADLPDVDGLLHYQPPVMSRVYAGDARPLAELASERRIFVPLEAIPDLVRQAFLSAEDQNFNIHRGVDPLAIARAALFNLTHMGQGRRPVGASTITQQVAKNMLLDNQISLARKIREAILAIRIEQTLSKDRILELYLNEIYLGLGSYGVAAAAQSYFNKPLEDLTITEAAFLAALPKAPNNYNPFRFPDAARARRDWVLDRMTEDRAITPMQALAAKTEAIVPTEFRRPQPIPGAEWFSEETRRQLIAQFGVETTTQGGLMVRTSLDPVLQLAAEKTLRDGLVAYDRRLGGWRGAVTRLGLGAALERDWQGALAGTTRPVGMPVSWQLAVVLSAGDQEARIGWLEPADGAPRPRTGILPVSDLAWARVLIDGKFGPVPRKASDLLQTGDVVMVEPLAADPAPVAQPARGRPPAAPMPRAMLRQIPLIQGALACLEPATGRVLALVGGWSFEQSQFNRATQAKRQPGSSFKPMVYLTALEQGISPSQKFLDAPLVLDTPEGRWRPANYEGTFSGPTAMRVALEKSLNLVTLRIARYVGMEAVADTAIRFHMVDSMPRVLPAALGAVETTILREAGAYAALAAGGREVIPTLIDSVQDRNGHVVWRAPAVTCGTCDDPLALPVVDDQRAQISDPASVFQLVTMMQGGVQRGTGVNAGRGLNRAIAGKTGTTQDFGDAWFSGFTPDLVTTVWVGFDTPSSLGQGETGGAVAAPIWHDFMAIALRDRPVLTFPVPPGVTMSAWDSGSGSVTDAFKPGQTPGWSRTLPGDAGSFGGGGGSASGGTGGGGGRPGGVDSGLGGLY